MEGVGCMCVTDWGRVLELTCCVHHLLCYCPCFFIDSVVTRQFFFDGPVQPCGAVVSGTSFCLFTLQDSSRSCVVWMSVVSRDRLWLENPRSKRETRQLMIAWRSCHLRMGGLDGWASCLADVGGGGCCV